MKWARIKYLFQWLRAPYIRDFALQIWVSNFLFQNKRRSFLGFLAHIPHLQTYVVLASSIAFISNLPRLCVPRVHHLYTTMCTCLSLSLSLWDAYPLQSSLISHAITVITSIFFNGLFGSLEMEESRGE